MDGRVQATNGALYGPTWGGGACDNGARRHIVEQRVFQRRCDALSALARPNAYGAWGAELSRFRAPILTRDQPARRGNTSLRNAGQYPFPVQRLACVPEIAIRDQADFEP